jgi:hypothetical protein
VVPPREIDAPFVALRLRSFSAPYLAISTKSRNGSRGDNVRRPGRGWRVGVVAAALGYVAYLPAIPPTHFAPPGDQAGVFEVAIGIAAAPYAVFAGFLGYHRPRHWPAAVVLPRPFVLGGTAGAIACRGTGFEPMAVGLPLAPIVTTPIG